MVAWCDQLVIVLLNTIGLWSENQSIYLLLIFLNIQIVHAGYVLTFGPMGHFNIKKGIWVWVLAGGYHRVRMEDRQEDQYEHFVGGLFKFPYLSGCSPFQIKLGGP